MNGFTDEERAMLFDVQGKMRSVRLLLEEYAIEMIDVLKRDDFFACFNGWTPWGWWRT